MGGQQWSYQYQEGGQQSYNQQGGYQQGGYSYVEGGKSQVVKDAKHAVKEKQVKNVMESGYSSGHVGKSHVKDSGYSYKQGGPAKFCNGK